MLNKVDSFIIIKALTLGNYSLIISRDINNLKIKSLCRSRRNLVTMRSKTKIQLVFYLDQIFPELAQFFKGNPHLNVSYQLLKEYSSTNQISSLHLTKLINILHDNSRGRYGKQDAIRLRELVKSSGDIDNPSLFLQIELYIEQIVEIETLYKSILDEMNTPILTISGMSYNQVAVIIGCIDDINRFEHFCQLLDYSGLHSSVIKSGTFQAKSTRMPKRDSGMVRYSLIYAAYNVVLNNKTFKEYYELKRSQGKSHYCALGHVFHKLVRII